MKTQVKKFASSLGVLPIIQKIRFKIKEHFNIKKNIKTNSIKNQYFLEAHPEFTPPPAHLAFDAYYEINWESYWEIGKELARVISLQIFKHCKSKNFKILDWGCGPCRIMHHLPKFMISSKAMFFGCDYNQETIEWCKHHFNKITFKTNQLHPPLSFDSNFFDVVYGISVFTHLSEKSHVEWIKELKRVLKPNGILILTTHGDYYKFGLSQDELLLYNNHQIVIQNNFFVKEGKRNCTAYHPPKFLKEKLFHEFEVLEFVAGETSTVNCLKQDLWVLRKIV